MCVACALCGSVWTSAENGKRGRPGGYPPATAVSLEAPASLPLVPPAGASVAPAIHPRHRTVQAKAGLQQRGTRLGVGVPDSDGLLDKNSVPSVWGPEHSMWARCMEGVRDAAAHCSRTAGSHS